MSERRETSESQSEKPISSSPSDSTEDTRAVTERSKSLEKTSEEGREVRPMPVYGETTLHIGPLPHPEILRQYENILPGSAERIMSLTETNTARRHERRKIGQFIGASVALSSILTGGSVVALSNSWPAAVFGVLIIAIGVGGPVAARVFVENFSKRNKNG